MMGEITSCCELLVIHYVQVTASPSDNVGYVNHHEVKPWV